MGKTLTILLIVLASVAILAALIVTVVAITIIIKQWKKINKEFDDDFFK